MKNRFGQASFAAAVLCSTPLLSIAQNIVSQTGLVNRSIERLTLLPGPYLLSPPRTTPTMMPSPMKLDAPPSLLFESSVPRFLPDGQVTPPRLIDGPSITPPNVSGSPKVQPRPSPESLRFDSTLEPATPETTRFRFIPKRD